ncbi:hypothetical protein KBB96_10590 [Luteolibacter ambystomatis]|uniref:Uncharacterized protein n=1 Tax=Luteolibacter ambystomatis TaxID=2824561 RepID=A0A975IXQ1_9BACT|nr:hypothetical protein [Luteolibacter ambystomatis]QUE49319.1 hypothetical protein KBB96_10590 [Luteolibacter ambystomatis]
MKKKALFTGCLLSVSLCGPLRAADVAWDPSPSAVGAGTNQVLTSIPLSKAVDGRLFIRISVP